MLSAAARLVASRDFRDVVRGGRKTGTRTLVLYLLDGGRGGQPQVGLIVSKAVGNAVVRHRVSRRLRHVFRPRVEALPGGSMVVVRALSRAGAASSDELAADVDRALRRLGVTYGIGDLGAAIQEQSGSA